MLSSKKHVGYTITTHEYFISGFPGIEAGEVQSTFQELHALGAISRFLSANYYGQIDDRTTEDRKGCNSFNLEAR